MVKMEVLLQTDFSGFQPGQPLPFKKANNDRSAADFLFINRWQYYLVILRGLWGFVILDPLGTLVYKMHPFCIKFWMVLDKISLHE